MSRKDMGQVMTESEVESYRARRAEIAPIDQAAHFRSQRRAYERDARRQAPSWVWVVSMTIMLAIIILIVSKI